MNCPKCGCELQENTTICIRCGARAGGYGRKLAATEDQPSGDAAIAAKPTQKRIMPAWQERWAELEEAFPLKESGHPGKRKLRQNMETYVEKPRRVFVQGRALLDSCDESGFLPFPVYDIWESEGELFLMPDIDPNVQPDLELFQGRFFHRFRAGAWRLEALHEEAEILPAKRKWETVYKIGKLKFDLHAAGGSIRLECANTRENIAQLGKAVPGLGLKDFCDIFSYNEKLRRVTCTADSEYFYSGDYDMLLENGVILLTTERAGSAVCVRIPLEELVFFGKSGTVESEQKLVEKQGEDPGWLYGGYTTSTATLGMSTREMYERATRTVELKTVEKDKRYSFLAIRSEKPEEKIQRLHFAYQDYKSFEALIPEYSAEKVFGEMKELTEAARDAALQLKLLDSLLKDGMLSEEDYLKKKEEVLRGL